MLSFFKYTVKGCSIQQIYGLEIALVKYGPVVEYAGQLLCLFKGIYLDKTQRDFNLAAVFLYFFNVLINKRTLHIVINCQLLVFDFFLLSVFFKPWHGPYFLAKAWSDSHAFCLSDASMHTPDFPLALASARQYSMSSLP